VQRSDPAERKLRANHAERDHRGWEECDSDIRSVLVEVKLEAPPEGAVPTQPEEVVRGKAVGADLSVLFLAPRVESNPQVATSSIGPPKIGMNDAKA
jgi:hypothetical protein